MIALTEEQKDLLILMGCPDDGSQTHMVCNGVRITRELIEMGLVHYKGKDLSNIDRYDLTDEGELLYGELAGEDVS